MSDKLQLPEVPDSLFCLTTRPARDESYRSCRSRTGLVVTTYDRPRLLRRLLATLRRVELSNCVLLLVDDASSEQTRRLVEEYRHPSASVITAVRRLRDDCQLPANLRFAWDKLVAEYGCERLLCLDADTLVQPDFLASLEAAFDATTTHGQRIVSGFNAPSHQVLAETPSLAEKASLGGVNLYFDAAVYASHVRETLRDMRWDRALADHAGPETLRFFATTPSVVQHTGRTGFWSSWRSGVFDFAPDYAYSGRLDQMLRQGTLRARHRLNQWLRRRS